MELKREHTDDLKKTVIALANTEGGDILNGRCSALLYCWGGHQAREVHIRQSTATVPATKSAILKMIRETGSGDYETTRSLGQEMTFVF